MTTVASPVSTTSMNDPKPRILVLCFDGTADQFSSENTNVVKFYSMLKKNVEEEQLCYYQTGVGTYENPGIMSPLTLWIAKILDEAIAWYLDAHVMGGYNFLMANYRVGDKICLFGFSRGAYTARALAGMLTKVGLLPRDNVEQVPFAYKMYSSTDSKSVSAAAAFKQSFCRGVEIEFLGVWETVASTGVIMSKTLPFTQTNTCIRTFRQALALDEHRAKFVPTFYHRPVPNPSADKNDPESAGFPAASTSADPASPVLAKQEVDGTLHDEEQGRARLLNTKGKEPRRRWPLFRKRNNSANPEKSPAIAFSEEADDGSTSTDVKEVWFAGVHTDVGGGSVDDNVTTSLSNIPLRWMVREVIASQCGIQFDPEAMARMNVHVDFPTPSSVDPSNHTLKVEDGQFVVDGVSPPATSNGGTSSSPSSTENDLDCMQPTHDQLVANPAWWLLEIIPLPFSWQNKASAWQKKWEFHMGRGRYVQQNAPLLIHESVKLRMDNASLKYTPRAQFAAGTQTYVS